MRVLVIEQGGRGGVADYTAALATALAAGGARVALATARDQTSYAGVPSGVRVLGVFRYLRDTSAVGRGVRRARLGRVANGLLFLMAIPRLVVLARRADVVHTEGWEDLRLGVLAVGALRLAGATVVQTEHNTFEREASLERTRKTLARMTARTIVHTRSDLPRAYAAPRGAVDVIPHGEYGGLARTGGDGDRARARAALGVPADAPAVLLFGQLRSDKGLGDLLRAALPVDGLHVIVAGEDLGAPAAERDAIAALGDRLHLRAEFIPMSDAAGLFAAADAVVLPYKRASQSGVLLLAYGFSRPVVAYPVGGLAEAVEDGETGWLTTAPDAGALEEALRAVVAAGPEEAARRGEAGRELAETRFAWSAIAGRTRETYAKALGDGSPDDAARRTARIVFARELADGTVSDPDVTRPDVLARLATKPVPPAPVRFAQLVQRRRGGLDFASAVAAPLDDLRRSVLGDAAAAPPRFLVRVDEFPHYQAWDEPGRFGTDRFQRFHTTLTEAGVPYCIAVPTRVSRHPLDPEQREWRPLDDGELAMLQRLQQDGVTIALHGRDHRTRFASPRRRSELSGLGAAATAELLDTALAELAAADVERPRVFVPPYNRFDAAQYAALASRFAVVCSGPETLQTMGFHATPQWRDGALYLPSYWPLYGHAREVLPAAEALIAARSGLWAPITLHWGWESDDGWTELEALVARLAGTTAHWDELLAAVDAAPPRR